jgi:peptide/nickel transport system permease protein
MMARLFGLLWVIFGVLVFTFLLLHLLPGDPVMVMLGESASSAEQTQLRQQLGLHLPLAQQFFNYLSHVLSGDWGQSIFTHESVRGLLMTRWWATAKLALLALAIGLMIGIPLGIIAAVRQQHWPDATATLFSLSMSAMPHFCLGPLLMLLFSIQLGWLPVSGMDAPQSIVLPALTLGFGLAAILTRMTRASLLEVLHEDFVRTARAKGLSERTVLMRHALRAACLPMITIVGLQLGSLLAGAVITETVFAWDGIGRLLVESIEKRDYPVTQACVMVIALSYVLINFCTDGVYRLIDPRLRRKSGHV